MIKRSFISTVFLLIGLSISSLWALSGKLVDVNNNPLADANVLLVNKNLQTTTDATGAFSFENLPVHHGTATQKYFLKPVLSGNRVYFSLEKNGTMEYAIYSLKGAIVSHYKSTLSEGNHFVSLPNSDRAMAKGMYVVRFKAEGQHTYFKYNYSKTNMSGSVFASGELQAESGVVNSSAKTGNVTVLTCVDTLIITKVIGDVTSTRKIRVFDYGDDINGLQYSSNKIQMVILDPSNDLDSDSLSNFQERYLFYTNDEFSDTDGDGKDDKIESTQNNMNPLIADYPSVSFIAKSYPLVIADFTESVGVDKSRTISSGGDYSFSSSFSAQQQVNASVSVAIMVGGEISKDPKLTGSITGTVGAGWGMTWGRDQSESVSRNWDDAQTYAESKGVTINGGKVIIEIELTNNSSSTITLVNPMIRLNSTDASASTISTLIGELTLFTGEGLSGDNEVLISSEPGKNSIQRRFGVFTNPDIIKYIAQNSRGFTASLTNIRMRKSATEIDSLMDNINNRTTKVVVDFGQALASPNNLIEKRVVSNAVYNDFYTNLKDRHLSPTLFDLLDTMGVHPVVGVDSGNSGITEINGVKNGALKNGIWNIVCQITPDSLKIYSTKLCSYDPKTIRVGKSSVISCIYDSDIDGDGLATRVEAVLGTDDTKIDTDSDGISDKDEFMGWRRDSDSAGVMWKTNALSMDTDGDGLNDYGDPYPLIAAKSPLDSLVSFTGLTLTPLQNTGWVDTTTIVDSSTTIQVNQIMRGPTALSMSFSHPVYMVSISCKNNTVDTVLYKPDNAGLYKANLNLALGTNNVLITATSKNGATTKKVLLTRVERRLARIDNFNSSLFSISNPSASKNGIEAIYYIKADSILKLDPLITTIMIARTAVYANAAKAVDSVRKLTADNLGDAGDGVAIINKGETIAGKDGQLNFYSIRNLTTISGSFPDTGLEHDTDYVYFPYTVGVNGQNHYYTAPLLSRGTYFNNERKIKIDSIEIFLSCSNNWGGTSPWVTWVYTDWYGTKKRTDKSILSGQYNSHVQSTSGTELNPMGTITWYGQYAVDYGIAGDWKEKVIGADLSYAQIVDNTLVGALTYGKPASGGYAKSCWYTEWYDGSYHNHTAGFKVFWSYKYNDIKHE